MLYVTSVDAIDAPPPLCELALLAGFELDWDVAVRTVIW